MLVFGSMNKKLRYLLWKIKQGAKSLYEYPVYNITPGEHRDVDGYWEKKRGNYLGALGRWQARRVDLSVAIIRSYPESVINDIGSGPGDVLSALKKRLPLITTRAYDASPVALSMAREMGITTELLDITHDASLVKIQDADFTLLFEVLEHVPNSEFLLKTAFDKSRIGVLFSIPNTGFLTYRFRLMFFGKFPLQWTKSPGEHVRFWTLTDLRWWLQSQGYADYSIQYYVGVPFLKDIWPSLFSAGFFVEVRKS